MSGERRAIVAVFGGNDVDEQVAEFAKQLGAAISGRGHVVLTGGEKPKVSAHVKDMALEGAKTAPWLGMPQPGFTQGLQPSGQARVIGTGLGHKRNYFEAFLCDVAVGLLGGPGTVSEILFSLWLGKPVVLVGRGYWEEKLELLDSQVLGVKSSAIEEARARIKKDKTVNKALDDLIEAAFNDSLKAPATTVVYDSPSPTHQELDEILKWIDEHARPLRALTPPESVFPVPGYEDVGVELEKWIRSLGAPAGAHAPPSGSPAKVGTP